MAARERRLLDFVEREFEAFLACGRLEHGFLQVRCNDCHAERLVAFSCKRRGFCSSCGTRRMAESAALLVDEIFPQLPIRQWVLSMPFALRFLLAREPQVISSVLGTVTRAIASYLITQLYRGYRADRRCDVDPALWIGAQSQRSLSHTVPGRRLPCNRGWPELPPDQGHRPGLCRISGNAGLLD